MMIPHILIVCNTTVSTARIRFYSSTSSQGYSWSSNTLIAYATAAVTLSDNKAYYGQVATGSAAGNVPIYISTDDWQSTGTDDPTEVTAASKYLYFVVQNAGTEWAANFEVRMTIVPYPT